MPSIVTGSYTGNGVSDRLIEIGGQPAVAVVIREDGGTNPRQIWKTSAMAGTLSMRWVDSIAASTEWVKSLTGQGFTVGNAAGVNENLVPYFYWALAADPSYLEIGTYTGDGNDNRNITTVFQPDIVFCQATSDGLNLRHLFIWQASVGGDDAIAWETAADPETNRIQGVGPSSFQVGTGLNANTVVYYWVALRRKDGIVADGTYTGNGLDNRNIPITHTDAGIEDGLPLYLFSPAIVQIKNNTSARQACYRMVQHTDATLFGDSAIADQIQALNTYQFQVGTLNTVNGNTVLYRWWAIFPGDFATDIPSFNPDPYATYLLPETPYTQYKTHVALSERMRMLKLR